MNCAVLDCNSFSAEVFPMHTLSIPRKTLLLSCLSLALALSLHATTVLYDLSETKLSGTTGANTFSVGTTGGLSYNSGASSLTWNLATTTPNYNYFVAYFDSTTLSVGQSIKLAYTFTPSTSSFFSNTDSAFRLGILNSGGSELSSNITNGVGSSTLNGYRGYLGLYPGRSGAGTSNSALYARNKNGDNIWDSATRVKITDSPSPTPNVGTSPVTGSFEISLISESTLRITSIINGGTAQYVDVSSSPYTTFDSISFMGFPSSSSSPSVTFTDLTVSLIPEPSSIALAAGASLLMLGVSLRRKFLAA